MNSYNQVVSEGSSLFEELDMTRVDKIKAAWGIYNLVSFFWRLQVHEFLKLGSLVDKFDCLRFVVLNMGGGVRGLVHVQI